MLLVDKAGIGGFCDFILTIAIVSFILFHFKPLLIALKLRKISREAITESELFREMRKINPFLTHKGEEMGNVEITDYINEYTTITYPGKRRVAQTIPGILTALGILGTFIGLVKGLVTFNVTNTETLSSSINHLMGGIRLAFYTSIVAIFSSIIWTFMDKLFLRFYDTTLEDFYRKIKFRFSLSTSKKGENTQFDNSFFQKLEKSFEKGMEKFAHVIRKEISSEFERLSKMNEELRMIQGEFAREVSGICNDLRNFRSNASELINQTREINLQGEKNIKELLSVTSALGKEAKQLSESSEKARILQGEIGKWSSEITEKLSNILNSFETSETMLKKQQNLTSENWQKCNDELKYISNMLNESVVKFSREASDSLENVIKEMDRLLSEATKYLSVTIKETKELMEELPGIVDELGKKLGK
jgi:hypothetical protein